ARPWPDRSRRGRATVGQAGRAGLGVRGANCLGQVLDLNVRAGRQGDGPFDDVPQFADVAGPVVVREHAHGLGTDALNIGTVAGGARTLWTRGTRARRRARSGGRWKLTTLSR